MLKFAVEEIMDFAQSDLAQEDIFILDAFHTLIIWTGKYANREEKNKAFEIALEFLKTGIFFFIYFLSPLFV